MTEESKMAISNKVSSYKSNEEVMHIFINDYSPAGLAKIEEAARNGSARAMLLMGYYCKDGYGVHPVNEEEAINWCKRALAAGDLAATYAVADNLPEESLERKKICQEAISTLTEAAESDDYAAAMCLGYLYSTGDGVEQNCETAVKWLSKAAKHNFVPAQNRLGDMYWWGTGVKQNYAEAAKWFCKAADQGHADAQFSLGNLYWGSKVVELTNEVAIQWLHKAAEQGHTDAQYCLALQYYDGEEIDRNYQ